MEWTTDQDIRDQRKKRALRTGAWCLFFLLFAAAIFFVVDVFSGDPLSLATLPSAAVSALTPARTPGAELDAYVIDVGQGDSIFVRSPSGRTLLVDAGDAAHADTVVSFLRDQNVEKLDVVVATHLHADHIGGMPAVLDAFPVGAFYVSPYASEPSESASLLTDALERCGIEPIPAVATMTSLIQWDSDVELRVLSPFDTLYEDANEASVVLRIQYGDTGFLLAADAGALAERLMVKALPNQLLHASVLKLGHHGSYSSTTEKFLNAVKPGVAIASCGRDNPFGHPDNAVRALLDEKNIPLLATSEYGTIHVVLDGVNVRVIE